MSANKTTYKDLRGQVAYTYSEMKLQSRLFSSPQLTRDMSSGLSWQKDVWYQR